MPKKPTEHKKPVSGNAYIKDAGLVVQQPITEMLQENYMPYAMSVIVSRLCRRSTASSPLIGSSFTPCIRWGF